MSHTTSNTTAFIEAQQYSQFILRNMHDGLLPTVFYRKHIAGLSLNNVEAA